MGGPEAYRWYSHPWKGREVALKPGLRKYRGKLACRRGELQGGCLVTPQRAVPQTLASHVTFL